MQPTIVLAVGLVACADRSDTAAGRSATGPRVVSLHDVTTEIVVALDATARVVGIADPVDATDEVRRAIAGVPRVAGLESILAVRPDVVLGLDVVEERDPELVRRLRERGIDVYLANPVTFDDVYAATRAVAARTGHAAAGERLITGLRARVASDTAPATARPVRVFVYDCCDPPFTAGGKTVLSDVIARAGGRNVFADLDADWTHVSWEAAVTREPELVVIHAYKYDGQGDVADKRRALAAIPALAKLPAVVIPLGWSLGGLRSADSLHRLRPALAESP